MQDERFAEWFVWAKREVSSDNRVCQAAAQAAVETLESGADEDAARRAARGSVSGLGEALVARIPLRRRAYAEWYDWARRELGGGRERQHMAARAALDRLDSGSDAASAASSARTAVGTPAAAAAPSTNAWEPPAAPGPPPPSAPGDADSAATAASAVPSGAPPVATVPAPVYPPYAMASPPPAPPVAPSEVYAGFWRRVAAYVIDSVLILIGFLVLDFLGNVFIGLGLLSSGQDLTTSDALGVAELVLLLLTLVLAWLYYAGMESAAWQGTVGKRILRLVVTDNYGRRIGFGRATGRFFAKILSGLILFVGYLMVAFTERKQGLHDLMASTLVIRQQHLALLTTPPPPASPAPPQGSGQPGGAGEVQGA